ncbi:sigma-70 family RNA polymerase sigma factor [Mycetocola zhadangensis]|uniref:Sigma-70 family RNA polymerase sigma factor n=1 Tax=Mycetocola zhadangensis TaxID=1164595 RepID=A0A3L7J4P9_9MICO|nr:sigma-70 family RNA polymerase sigma factor [Mycetocola zhadangensis]RLQ85678.1 sigma-70 family RNA polymerase sigma factor [Mycetocola zhadangensis]GGE84737.1 DNA-directed RNA polymerase sigma-70 factor [Mycetocola zhadangensis]
MAASDSDEFITETFREQRGRLYGVAYRLLGSSADAEDAVQEAWLRFARQDASSIDNLGGWLTTVVGRVCIDMLRSRAARKEVPFQNEMPELAVIDDAEGAPEDEALLADSLAAAMLVVLDTLSPAERLSFVLHDMFAVPFEEIGPIVGKSTNASKMLASRARRKVRGAPRPDGQRRQERAIVDAFLAAARNGDFDGLLRVLDPNVTWHTYGAHGVDVITGATEVAATAQRRARATGRAHPVLVNGMPGIVAWTATGKPVGVLACTVVAGRIVQIVSSRDPQRLARMDLPGSPG